MTKYEAIYNLLEKKVEQGVITESEATELNILAYEKYVMTEGKKEDDLEMIDSLRSKIDSGDAKLSKDAIEEIKKLIGEDESKDDESKDDESKDDDKEEVEESAFYDLFDEDDTLYEAVNPKAAFKNMKRKFQISKLDKETKGLAVSLQKSYEAEMDKLQGAYKEAVSMLDSKFAAKAQKIDDKYQAKFDVLMNK